MPISQTPHKEQQLRQLIELLVDGDFHSGQTIADELGVSRAYVWKLIQQLQEYGLGLESVSGKGYCWNDPSALFDKNSLDRQLAELSITQDYYLLTDSTNQRLKQSFKDQHLVLAEFQTSGRGRRGRSWQSPLAANLYFSYGWRCELPVQQLGGLSLVVGIAMVEALQALGWSGLKLKWPNDIRHRHKKLAGILVELTGDAAGGLEVIIGAGLNVNMLAEQSAISQDWTSLAQLRGELVARESLLLAIMRQLQQHLMDFEQKGFAAFIDNWNQYDETLGSLVELSQGKRSIEGIARGVDAFGALLLEVDGKLESHYAGEVSLRLKV
ncbi:bifunctional biotin--[acetyl-CoA-carboxylase] ligase/biotin operon repressor BirA [Kangiella sp. TOML190]|uniref:bifunctional biotin--[acetyl-CoA-carboxylase] ligase/biotin operon repressor BirA n=1 Tax=Kangiella sp. TOML190 TaxID=2931351 RepID=UPI002041F6B9|nr:bifunctional biotin--[acetyl-CoA-carboxylase] ligase/biotin operon repressor BirA [Kangiella sp. TOML190]